MSKRMTAADHHAQDALERLAAVRLQQLAEDVNRAHGTSAAEQLAKLDAELASKGHTWDSLLASDRAATYKANLDAATADFFPRLCKTHPEATFSFDFSGTTGRIAQIKGDINIEILTADLQVVRSVSLKNYQNGPARIQVGSGTFQSFAVGFFLESAGIGKWKHPDGSQHTTNNAAKFRPWRDSALRASILDHDTAEAAVALFGELDSLHDEQRSLFLSSETFSFYKEDEVSAERARIGTEGARIIRTLVALLPADRVRARMLKATGLLDGEDLLVFGDGQIADTLTDDRFGAFVTALRGSRLEISSAGQSVSFSFLTDLEDGTTEPVLDVEIPCTINTNGAWYRDGDPYEGVRWHASEKRDLAWGERRPRKSSQIATSTNTYLNLGSTGLLRTIQAVDEETVLAETLLEETVFEEAVS
jgi:hypothetical protein